MKKLLIALPFLWMLVSCAKKVQPMPSKPSCHIISKNDEMGNSLVIPIYNSDGNLVELHNNNPDELTHYFSYTNNRIDVYNRGQVVIVYKYNTLNRIETIEYDLYDKDTIHSDDNTTYHKVIFGYDAMGNIATKTTYHKDNETLDFQDSCMFTNYVNGRPLKMEKKIGSAKLHPKSSEIYDYVYDHKMNRTKTYLTKTGIEHLLIEECTFDLNIDISSITKYTYLTENHIISHAQELFMAGALYNNNMAINTKEYDENGALIFETNIEDMKTIHGIYPKSWKAVKREHFDIGTTTYLIMANSYYNLTYSCE